MVGTDSACYIQDITTRILYITEKKHVHDVMEVGYIGKIDTHTCTPTCTHAQEELEYN